jgi:uncharacterized YccA/Bax inhibitor family protein
LQTANPALRSSAFTIRTQSTDAMTIGGAVNKTLICALILIAAAGFVWFITFNNPGRSTTFMIGGALGGLALAITTIVKPSWSPITTPIYCILEGLLIGGITSMMEFQFPGIAFQAALLTIGALLTMLFAYKAGWIKVTEKFKSGLLIAIGGIALVYLTTIGLGFFGIKVPYIHEGGMIGIGFSIAVIIIASLSLVLDFDFIKEGSRNNIPKYMEWYAAFSLMVTLIWLYRGFQL